MRSAPRRKLIEVTLPLEAINVTSDDVQKLAAVLADERALLRWVR